MAAGEIEPSFVVGVGASAGGLDALERLFAKVPADTTMAFVVAQHLSPDHKSMMAELLGKRTVLPVVEATHEQRIAGGRIHLVPAHANVSVAAGELRLSNRAAPHTLNLPIDQMLRTLADSYGERSVAVVLSGTGSDGREGVIAVKGAGGIVIVQDPASARFDGMPREAIRTGVADAVLAPEQIPLELERIAEEGRTAARVLPAGSGDDDALAALAEALRRARGFDVLQYKRSTVLRRIERRITARRLDDLAQYVEVLRAEPDECVALVQDILINVTQFFRDHEVFDALEATVLPELCGRAGNDTLRVWVPGCSTGQEVYSIAMLLSEQGVSFKIFGTDVDDDALARAMAGIYDEDALADVTPARRTRFFTKRDGRYEIDRELRKHVVFAPHDVLSDPPFTRMHLVSCRNLLIYLTPPAQRRALDAMAFALRPGGVLVLGTSEVVGDGIDEFKVLDPRLKLYQRRDVKRAAPAPSTPLRSLPSAAPPGDDEQAASGALRVLVDRVVPGAVLVNEHLRVVRVFGNAGALLTLPVGTPSLDVLACLPPHVRTEASVALHRALSTHEEVVLTLAASDRGLRAVRALPFRIAQPATWYALLLVEPHEESPSATVERGAEVAVLERELEQARQSLQAAVEELESSNEELQATNEELLASNEELQSTNEELQSVNEELHTVNVEHQLRITELSEANADLDNLLNATPVATMFLDEQLRIRRFNPPVADLFPLVEADRGRSLTHFASQLLSTPLQPDLERVLSGATTVEREVVTLTSRRFYLRAVPHVGAGRRVCGVVVTFSDITALHESRESQELLQGVIDALPSHIAVLDGEGVIKFVNAAWARFARDNGADPRGTSGVGASYLHACGEETEIRTALEAVLRGLRDTFACEYPCDSPAERRTFRMEVARTLGGRWTVVQHTRLPAPG